MKNIGIIALGNPFKKDDGIGILLLEKLQKEKFFFPLDIDFIDCGTIGMNLIAVISQYDNVIVIDAVDFDKKPGYYKLFKLEDAQINDNEEAISIHNPDILKILKFSKKINKKPKKIFIFGVQPKNIEFGDNISEELKNSLNIIYINLKNEIMSILKK